jgi:hypothetical protein
MIAKIISWNETRFAAGYGQRELRQHDRRTAAAEIDRASNRFDWNDPGTKILNHRHWRGRKL